MAKRMSYALSSTLLLTHVYQVDTNVPGNYVKSEGDRVPNPQKMVLRARQMLAIWQDLKNQNDQYAKSALRKIKKKGIVEYFLKESGGKTAEYPVSDNLTTRAGRMKLGNRISRLKQWKSQDVSGEAVRQAERQAQANFGTEGPSAHG